MSMWE
jgi:hypothetical protein